jgi:hypothetical protein
VPKNETCELVEKRVDKRTAKTTPAPAYKSADLGKLILPSKNLAKPQKMIATVRPTTRSRPLEVSIGILVKGKKKSGNNIMIKKVAKKDILSK